MLKRKISKYYFLPYVDTKDIVLQDRLGIDNRIGEILKLIYKTVQNSEIELSEEKTWFVIKESILKKIIGDEKEIPAFYFALKKEFNFYKFEKYFEVATDQLDRLIVGVTEHIDELFTQSKIKAVPVETTPSTRTRYSVKRYVLQKALSIKKNRPLTNTEKALKEIIIVTYRSEPIIVKEGSESIAVMELMDLLGELLLDKTDEEIEKIAEIDSYNYEEEVGHCRIHASTNEIVVNTSLEHFLYILTEGLYRHKKHIAFNGPIRSFFDRVYFSKNIFLKIMRDYARAGEDAIDIQAEVIREDDADGPKLLVKYVDFMTNTIGETVLEKHQWYLD